MTSKKVFREKKHILSHPEQHQSLMTGKTTADMDKHIRKK